MTCIYYIENKSNRYTYSNYTSLSIPPTPAAPTLKPQPTPTTTLFPLFLTPTVICGPFIMAGGEHVCFIYVDQKWQARVTHWKNKQKTVLNVYCQGDIATVLQNLIGKSDKYTKEYLHVIATLRVSWAPWVVYVGICPTLK
jgi:hypothetical protein